MGAVRCIEDKITLNLGLFALNFLYVVLQ